MQSSKQFQNLASSHLRKYTPNTHSKLVCTIFTTSLPRAKATQQAIISSSPSRYFSTSTFKMTTSNTAEPVHILGLGNLGKLFTHALTASSSPTPITILTHRPGLPYAFQQSGSTISILRNGIVTSTPTDLVTISPISSSISSIRHLIVTTKAADTASALRPLVSKLGPESTILFTQNGMGVVDEVNQVCFPEKEKRPTYLTAIVVHGVFSTGPFSATHAAVADMKIGYTSNGSDRPLEDASARDLLGKIIGAESLVAKEVDPRELIAVQLEKLCINACINPLTVIFRTLNGGLLNPLVTPLRRVLCQEASETFLEYLNWTIGLDEGLKERFEAGRLENMVRDVTERVRENKSSMYQDFDAGRETEIRYINGWFVKIGQRFGVGVRTQERLVSLVEGKKEVKMEDIGSVFPETSTAT